MNELENQLEYIEKCRHLVEQISKEKKRPLTACITTFGCQMNARDSEKLTGILKRSGYLITEDENADFVE